MSTQNPCIASPATTTPKPRGGVQYPITGNRNPNKDEAAKPDTAAYSSPPPRQAIALLVLHPALGFDGPHDEFQRHVAAVVPNCFHHSLTEVRDGSGAGSLAYRCPVISLEHAEAVALATGGSQAACVAYLLSEIRCAGDAVEILSTVQLQILGSPFVRIQQPRQVETSARFTHRLLQVTEDYDSWWSKKRASLGWKHGREYHPLSGGDARLSLPHALEAMVTELNARGRLVWRVFAGIRRMDIHSQTPIILKSWYLFLHQVVLADIHEKTLALKQARPL